MAPNCLNFFSLFRSNRRGPYANRGSRKRLRQRKLLRRPSRMSKCKTSSNSSSHLSSHMSNLPKTKTWRCIRKRMLRSQLLFKSSMSRKSRRRLPARQSKQMLAMLPRDKSLRRLSPKLLIKSTSKLRLKQRSGRMIFLTPPISTRISSRNCSKNLP